MISDFITLMIHMNYDLFYFENTISNEFDLEWKVLMIIQIV